MDRRGYPEDRGPHPAAPLAPPPPPAPARVEKKPEIKNIDDILKPPGRMSRPERVRFASSAFKFGKNIVLVCDVRRLQGACILTDCRHNERPSRKWKKPRCKTHTSECYVCFCSHML